MNNRINDFLESDIQDDFSRDKYLALAKNIHANHLELAGNAYYVTISTNTVRIECLWDEAKPPINISLETFIQILSNLKFK